MTLIDAIKVLRERWLVLVICVVLGLAGAVAANLALPKQYESRMSLFVASRVISNDPSKVYEGTLLAQQRVNSYAALLTSDRVTGDVVAQLRSPLSPTQLAGEISTSVVPDSLIIGVTVTDESPTEAARIANALAGVVTATITDLERPDDPDLDAPITIKVIKQATVDPTPVSPHTTTNLLLGAVAGLLVGLGAIFVANTFDRSVKSGTQLRQILSVPVLGVTAYDVSHSKRPLTVHDSRRTPRAEAFRQLRTNLQFVRVDDPPRCILITSAVTGDGTTTTACNLATALADTGRRVILVETNLWRPRMSEYLGVPNSVGVTGVLIGEASLEQATQKWAGAPFDLLTSGPVPADSSELLSSQRMVDLLADLRKNYDIVLLDSAPVLAVADALALAPHTDGVLLVVQQGKTRQNQIQAAAEAIRGVSARLLGSVLTMTRRSEANDTYYRAFKESAAETPSSNNAKQAPAANSPAPNSPAPNSPASNSPAPKSPAPNSPAPNSPAPTRPAPSTPAPTSAARASASPTPAAPISPVTPRRTMQGIDAPTVWLPSSEPPSAVVSPVFPASVMPVPSGPRDHPAADADKADQAAEKSSAVDDTADVRASGSG